MLSPQTLRHVTFQRWAESSAVGNDDPEETDAACHALSGAVLSRSRATSRSSLASTVKTPLYSPASPSPTVSHPCRLVARLLCAPRASPTPPYPILSSQPAGLHLPAAKRRFFGAVAVSVFQLPPCDLNGQDLDRSLTPGT